MRKQRVRWASALLIATLACEDPAAVESDLLVVRSVRQTLELTNISDDRVYTFIADRDILPLLDWAPCSNPATCDGLEPGATRVVPFDLIIGYESGSEAAVVYHWRLVPAATESGYAPDSIRFITVDLR
jgi:hypothetical protein